MSAPARSLGERNFRGKAFDVPADEAHDFADERRRQSEIARIRSEIMDIAREVAKLRRHETANPAEKTSATGRPVVHHDLLARNPAPAPRLRHPEVGPAEQRPRIANGRRHQLIERAHRQARNGTIDPAIVAAPDREQWPVLAIGDDEFLQPAPSKPKAAGKAKPAAKRKDAVKPTKPRGFGLAAKAALFAALILAGTAMIAVALSGKLPPLAQEPLKASRLFADASSAATETGAARLPQLASGASDHTSALYPYEMPDTYGVYAVGEGHLTALEPLPIRIPDARVSISSAVTKPAPAPVTDGTPLFVVYHRELATNVPESASVRVFAKVMQASTFVGGKPKALPVEDTWAVRGGAIDLRIAPVAANKEMILIRPADPNFTLSPGRYVLMYKNQAYDFSVAGEVTDTAHCLERSDLDDRSVYSECRQLPASAAKS